LSVGSDFIRPQILATCYTAYAQVCFSLINIFVNK
jgi:hypothetical protein